MKLIFNQHTRQCIGTVEGEFEGEGLTMAVTVVPPDLSILYLDDQGLVQEDSGKAIAQARQTRIARIKTEARHMLEATEWKLQRAQEQYAAGWVDKSAVDEVLALRQSIRLSSNAAEADALALEDVQAVHAYEWTGDKVRAELPMKEPL